MLAGLLTSASSLIRPWHLGQARTSTARLVVGQSLRLEGGEPAHPLGPGWRRLARDRRSGEVPFGVALPALLGLVLNGPEQAAPEKVSLHAPDQALQNLAYFAGPEMAEPPQATSRSFSHQAPSRAIMWRCGLSCKSDDVLCTAVAAPLFAPRAHDPAELLRRRGSALHPGGQYVTAAYLWLDTETRTARYSAAGHPPFLRWRAATRSATRIESNGLLFGVVADSEYPVRDIAFDWGDRFLLYTDGLTEPESAAGEPFGDSRLEQVLLECESRPAEELSAQLLAALAAWSPASVPQQDDITFLIIDAL